MPSNLPLRKGKPEEQGLDSRIQVFVNNFLSTDNFYKNSCNGFISSEDYTTEKISFLNSWFSNNISNDNLDLPDDQQLEAIAAVHGNTQVIARAGSGKTSTLVNRAFFLMEHCGVSPSELLLLAFNNTAALEMKKRLEHLLKGNPPHVMTFHALAYALVHPEEDLLFDNQATASLRLSREIQKVIDDHLRSEVYRSLIRDLMLAHFQEDWERIIDGGFHLPIAELIKYRSALPRETLNGEYVKSFGERLIANTLFNYGIEYNYERNFRWGDINYKPDFTLSLADRKEIIIEYFGMVGDPDYDEMSEKKREFWAARGGSTLLEFTPNDIACCGVAGFEALLLRRLETLGVKGQRLSEEEVWERIRRRAIDKFTGAMKLFVSRCRKNNFGPDELRQLLDRHVTISEPERLFLEVGTSIFTGYLTRLNNPDAQMEDFDGLIWRAVDLLAKGQSRFVRNRGGERGDIKKLRYVLVDEFQDFSKMFYALSQEIRFSNPEIEFFCVGDDWQAINGFAGSDLRYFEDFKGHFGESSSILNVSTNYRSAAEIVQLGNALMAGRGTPAVPNRSDSGKVVTACLGDFKPTPAEQARHQGDEATPAILRLVKHEFDSGHDVVMLSHRNQVPWYVNYSAELLRSPDGLERFVEHIRSFLAEEDRRRVTISTSHSYKGLQKGAVIILDANEGIYPLIHPSWVFLRVFGDSVENIEAEERRLFYVALTRAKHSLVILNDNQRQESPYLKDIRRKIYLKSVQWQGLPPLPSLVSPQLEVRVLDAYDVRDQLKARGYRWNSRERAWQRSVGAEGFDFKALCEQPWAMGNVSIKVYTESGELLEQWPPLQF